MAHGSFRASLCTPASANLLLNVNQGAGLVAMLIEGQNSLNNTKYPLPADHAALCVPPPQPQPQPISLPDDSGKYTTGVVVGSAFSNCFIARVLSGLARVQACLAVWLPER